MRNLIEDFASDGMLSPVLEKEGILGNTGRRPGDVTIQRWAEGKGLAIDMAVTRPLAPTYVRKDEPCEWYAATQTANTMQAFRALSISFLRSFLRLWGQSMWKAKRCYIYMCMELSKAFWLHLFSMNQRQACLTPWFGGLGLRIVEKRVALTFHAS